MHHAPCPMPRNAPNTVRHTPSTMNNAPCATNRAPRTKPHAPCTTMHLALCTMHQLLSESYRKYSVNSLSQFLYISLQDQYKVNERCTMHQGRFVFRHYVVIKRRTMQHEPQTKYCHKSIENALGIAWSNSLASL